jgi:chromosome segregation ATPase
MEQQATDAQQVLTEKDAQEGQQQQISDRREMLDSIVEIQDQLKLVEAKLSVTTSDDDAAAQAGKAEAKSLAKTFTEAGSDLRDAADKLVELKGQVALTSEQEKELSEAAARAKDKAEALKSFDASVAGPGTDAQFDELLAVQDDLVKAYEKLAAVAEGERDRSTLYANIARGLAWVLTAIGTLMLGNWKKLLGVSDEGKEEAGE